MQRMLRPLIAAALIALIALGVTGPTVPAAHAATVGSATVSVSPGTADPDYATKIALKGSGFQAIAKAFGGIYVLFGTVSGTWQPSAGGVSGVDYLYVPDSETKDNSGFQRFVSFEGSSSESSANGGTIAADGTWSAELIVPGAIFTAGGRNGEATQVDCLQVQCGIITIGAHGVVNSQNETFTPIDFATPTSSAGRQGDPTQTADPAPTGQTARPTAATETVVAAASSTTSAASTQSLWWIVAVAAGLAVILLIAGMTSIRRARKRARS